MCTPLTLIHAHQAERICQPWQKYAGSSIKPPGTDQRAVPGSAVVLEWPGYRAGGRSSGKCRSRRGRSEVH